MYMYVYIYILIYILICILIWIRFPISRVVSPIDFDPDCYMDSAKPMKIEFKKNKQTVLFEFNSRQFGRLRGRMLFNFNDTAFGIVGICERVCVLEWLLKGSVPFFFLIC